MTDKPKAIRIFVVVSGQAVELAARAGYTVRTICKRALLKSGNVGVRPEDWEVRATDGALIAPATRIGALARADGAATIWLAPRAGWGGSVLGATQLRRMLASDVQTAALALPLRRSRCATCAAGKWCEPCSTERTYTKAVARLVAACDPSAQQFPSGGA